MSFWMTRVLAADDKKAAIASKDTHRNPGHHHWLKDWMRSIGCWKRSELVICWTACLS